MVAAGGGIGGGGILVPIYILVMGFSPKHAIPLSNITVFGGALANTYLNAKKRHPLADRPLVDWDLILVMEPLTIAGALIGAFLNKLLPEELLVFLLVALLSFTAYNTLKKAIKMYKAESKLLGHRPDGTRESELTRMAHQQEEDQYDEAHDALLFTHIDECANQGDSGATTTLANLEHHHDCATAPDQSSTHRGMMEIELDESDRLGDNLELKRILEEEKSVPMGNIKMLIIMFVVVLFINIMKGGGALHSPLGIVCGSNLFWIACALVLLSCWTDCK